MDDLWNEVPCGLFSFTEAGLLIQVNATVGEHVGCAPDELIGQPVGRLFTVASRMFYQTHLLPLVTLHGRVDELAITLRSSKGLPVPVLLNARRQQRDGTGLIHCAYLPVNQRHQFEAELIQARTVAEEARKAVEDSERRFRQLADAVTQMIWTNRPTGEIDFWNQRWYDYTDRRDNEDPTQGWQAVVHPDDLAGTLAAYQRALTTGEVFVVENRYRRAADGHYYWHLNRAEPLRDETGAIRLWVGTATNIDDRKRQSELLEEQVSERTRALEAANFDLQRSNENLLRFAYVASHDLQEPLRKIQSFGDLLKTTYAHQLGEGADYLSRMQLAAARMSMLIKDLLAFSRISTQRHSFGLVSLNDLVAGVLGDLELTIQESDAVVEVGTLPTVVGDALQLGQLFQNLIANALKFRQPNQPPYVRISCQPLPAAQLPSTVKLTSSADTFYRITVADNGIGFDEKYLDRMFEVFQRLHGKNQYGGTGIGLAIVQKVAENHGGATTATSQPGQGAQFMVYLPAD